MSTIHNLNVLGTGAGNDRHYWVTCLGGFDKEENKIWSELSLLVEYTPGSDKAEAKARLVKDAFDHVVDLQEQIGVPVRIPHDLSASV